MEHIVTASFAAGQTRVVAEEPLYQYDYGQTLKLEGIELPAVYQVDFSNFEYAGNSIPQIGGEDGVTVPVDVLVTGRDVYAFVWLQDTDSGRTQYRVEIPVIPRPAPDPEDLNPEQQSMAAELIAALNAGVEAAETAQGKAEDAQEAAETAQGKAEDAQEAAETAQGKAEDAQTAAETAQGKAVDAKDAAIEAKNDAIAAKNAVEDMGATAETLAAGSSATVEKTVDPDTGAVTLNFGIPKGDKGDTGATPDFSIGTVTTGAAGSSAAATITGTDEAPVLNLTIPQGLKGDAGNGDMLAPSFSTSTSYAAGDYVIYSGSLYRFTAAHAAGAWTGTDASAAEIANDVRDLKSALTYVTPEMFGAKGDGVTDDSQAINAALSSGFPVFLSAKTYAVANSLILNPNGEHNILLKGSGLYKTQIKWIGSAGGIAIKTLDYSSRDTQNIFGVLSDFSIVYPYSLLYAGSKGIYIAEPNIRLESIEIRMGDENTSSLVVEGTVGIELDGCTNKGPFPLVQCSVYGQVEKGFDIRTSHATLISCATGYTNYGVYIENDSLGSDANPPYSTTIVSYHSYQDKIQCVYIDRARDVVINNIFAECSGSTVFIAGGANFNGSLTVYGSQKINNAEITAPSAIVYYKNLQHDSEIALKSGVNAHALLDTYFGVNADSWQSSNGNWVIGRNNRKTNCRGYVKANVRFRANGSGTCHVYFQRTPRTISIGNYSSDSQDVVLGDKSFVVSSTAQDYTFSFILTNQNWGSEQYGFVRVTGDLTISNKEVEIYYFN